MAGTKRRRGGSKGSTAATSAASSNPTSESSSSSVIQVLNRLMEISKSPPRSLAVLQGFCDGKCWMEQSGSSSNKKNSQLHIDCYWIILGTHFMNRLLPITDDASTIPILAAFCESMSSILLSDKQKLERASHVTASRSVIARAVLTTTVSSLCCLEQYEFNSANTLQACISTLDRLVHLQGTAESNISWSLPDKIPLSLNAEEEAFIACVNRSSGEVSDEKKKVATPSPTPTKRKSRRKTAAAAATAHSPMIDATALFKALEDLQKTDPFYSQRIDGRVALKRWASMTLVWLCQGQCHLLELTHEIALDTTLARSRKSEWMNKLVNVVCEAGTHCGLRPPTAGMDQYLKNILSWDKKRFPNSSRKATKLQRADIRDWAVVAIHDLISVHKQCLQNVTSSNLFGAAVVNELEDGDDDGEKENGNNFEDDDKTPSSTSSDDDDIRHEATIGRPFTAPDLSSTLANLSRAASSSVSNSSYSEQAQWTKSLMSLAMSNALEVAADSGLPLDCKLTNFALTHLVDTLRHLESQPRGEGNGGELEQSYSLTQPLPLPDVSMIDQNYSSPNRTCTFAGLESSLHFGAITEDQALAMAMRALSSSSTGTPAAKLVTVLTDIVSRAYDTRQPTPQANEMEEKEQKPRSKKRGAKGSDRRSKRRKTEQGPVEISATWGRLSKPRALVATEALNALRFCLSIQTYPRSLLRHSIRKSLTTKHYLKLIELGELLDKVLVKTRVSKPLKIPTSDDDYEQGEDPFLGGEISDFSPFEKGAWVAHMGMCQMLGRGCSTYEPGSQFMHDPILGASNQRKILFQSLAKSHKSRHAILGWPLSLPAAHHALLLANLSSERMIASRALSAAELYVTKEFTKSIQQMLVKIQNLKPKEWEVDNFYIDDEIPLSYQDARIFILAFCRLIKEDQRCCLEELITQTSNAMAIIQGDEGKRLALTQSDEASSFLARVLVLCYCIVDIVTIGNRLETLHFAGIGSAHIKLPQFVSTTDWYRCERCFMGMFTWESPGLPDSTLPSPSMNGLKERTIKDFRQLLEASFQLGFESARQDKCHLLFAAWNGLNKIHLLGNGGRGVSPQASTFPTLQSSAKDNLSAQFLQLREDICFAYLEVNQEASSTISPARLKSSLRNMLDRADVLLCSLLSSHVPDDDDMSQEVPISVFALLSALPTYISASVAAHTKPGNDYFSSLFSKTGGRRNRRPRGYSSDSEILSDADSVETDGGDYDSDTRADALSRLKDCCHAFGAAPIHPDWLDVSCSLRDGIRHSDAVEVAEEALRTLAKLISTAFIQYKKHQSKAVKVCSGKEEKNIDDRVNLCLNLCQWASHEPSNSSSLGPGKYNDEREWKDDIATICDLPQEVVELLLEEPCGNSLEQARDSWCPNSIQRLSGPLQDRERLDGSWETSAAELRAGGEWELLLAEALTVSCLDVKNYSSDSSDSSTADLSSRTSNEEMVTAQLWRNILVTAANHLMPAAALLRLGLAKVGRKPHPFCFPENNEDPFDVVPLHFSERLSAPTSVPAKVRQTVFRSLSLLSRLGAEGDDVLSSTCHAVASHFLSDSNSFFDLKGLQCIRIAVLGIKQILHLVGKSSQNADKMKTLPFVVERLISIIEDFGRLKGKDPSSLKSPADFRRLLAFFGATGVCRMGTILESSVDSFEILAKCDILELGEEMGKINKSLKWKLPNAIKYFVSALCKDSLNANERTRSCLAMLISRISQLEIYSESSSAIKPTAVVVPAVIKSFNTIDEQRLKDLVLNDFCCLSGKKVSDTLPALSFRKDLANIFSVLLSSKQGSVAFSRSKLVFDILIGSFDSWAKLRHIDREDILETFFLYGCRFNSLQEISRKLVARVSDIRKNSIDTRSEIELITKFFAYLRDLRDVLSHRNDTEMSVSHTSGLGDIEPKTSSSMSEAIKAFPRSCSYVQKSGFHGQHWYNCYTCGLVWDKGCCSLCALVCHRGHDVSYSRCSSFFCDCGAESSSAAEQNRVSCKCLSPISKEQVRCILENEAKVFVSDSSQPGSKNSDDPKMSEHGQFVASKGTEIARDSFKVIALSSLENFAQHARKSPWLDVLFSVVHQEFESWKDDKSTKSNLEYLLLESRSELESKPMTRVSHLSQRRKLRSRRGKELDLQTLSEPTMIPVRSVKGFQVKMSSDGSTNAHLLSNLARHEVSRSILVADSRGRMILAESCSLLCCSAIPPISVRYVNRPFDTPLIKKQMCILGTASIKFNIVGMQLCAENENHLVVWGTSDACVAILNSDWTKVEEKINLAFNVSQHDSDGDYLVRCEWIPGSQTHVAVGCSRFVRIYDIAKSDKERSALAVVGYNLGFEACLRDVTIVPFKGFSSVEDRLDGNSNISKMFLLLENGRLHVVDLKTSSSGRLESPGDQQHIEPSECVSLSMTGVRPRSGSSVGHQGSSTRTLGEGSRLAYLKQSRILLYKCTSSCVLALMLDKEGGVEGSFELIPHTISSEILGETSDGHSISGPYTHWTELGMAYRDGASFFRVACIGKSLRTNQPKLLCIEFNETEVRVREMSWSPSTSLALGLGMVASFDGLAAFSAPHIGESQVCGERAFLCAVTSTGTLLFYGEEFVDALPSKDGLVESARPLSILNLSSSPGAAQVKKPSFPLTLFEKLKNITEWENVVFGGHGIGSDPDDLKARLLRDSGSSLICPTREGCTLTISLRNNPLFEPDAKNLAIVAVRVLVGSTSNYIPSKLYVQGRPVDLTPRVKKWYCLPLTNEEIALAMRNGFMSLGIGPSFDSSSNIIIDSIEVFGAERASFESWLPKAYFSSEEKVNSDFYAMPRYSPPPSAESCHAGPSGLILSARALTFLCELVGSKKLVSEGEREFLHQLVQETALDRDPEVRECVQTLLERLEPDNRSRQSFHDESLLFGCSKALSQAKVLFDDSMSDDDEENDDEASGKDSKWKAVGFVLKDCLNAASSIARERPMNYLQSMGNIVENNISSASIARDVSEIILAGLKFSAHYEDLVRGSTGVIDLSLTEMAIEHNNDAPHSKQFANFDVIRGFLESDDLNVVQRCCDSISAFCRKHGGFDTPTSSAPDLFTLLQHARLVAYQCDSCSLFPMKEIRYTLLEEDHDIDLCKDCYNLGSNFAEKAGFDSKREVIINGKSVGAETKLTCAQMRQLQPVSLEKMDVEQVEVNSSGRRGSPPSDESVDDDEELKNALKLSLGENTSDEPDAAIGVQAYEDFVGHLFSSVVELFGFMLKRENCGPLAAPLIRLLLDLVQLSRQADSKSDRAKRFAKELSHGISYILKLGSGNQKLPQDKILTLVTCLRAFSNLLAPESDSQYYLAEDEENEESRSSRQKEKTNPNFICDEHKIPAVRRRCARGVHKDRRFYVCGKERGQRCKYFVWADEVSTKPAEADRLVLKSPFLDVVKGYFWSHGVSSGMALHTRLCRLLENEIFDGELDDDFDAALSFSSSSSGKKSDSSPLKSHYGAEDKQRDFMDGVFCSREKLQDIISGEQDNSRELPVPVRVSGDRSVQLLEASLDLLVSIADHRTDDISRWFSLLCEINVSTNKPASLRTLAKKVLKSLCGGKQTLYHSVRDHFAFWFQLKRLYRNSSPMLEAALVVKEKARNCRPDWISTDTVTWANLGVGALIGTHDLISEDKYTQLSAKMIGKVLDELYSVIKNRGDSWRQFCGLRSLPHSHRDKVVSGSANSSVQECERCLTAASPITSLFWIASSLTGSNQGKVLRLIDFALTNWKERNSSQITTNDGDSDNGENQEEHAIPLLQETPSIPEELLLSGERKLSVDDIVAFVASFVCGGKTLELRRLAHSVALKLCLKLSTIDQGLVFQSLVSFPFDGIGKMGKTSVEFLNLLQTLAPSLDATVPVKDAANLVMECFEKQMDAVRYDRSNGEWFVLEAASATSTVKKRFDLSCCQHCQRLHHTSSKESAQKSSERRESSSSRSSRTGQSASASSSRASSPPPVASQNSKKWHTDQVCPFSRGRLDSIKETSSSNEFCSFYMLKYRVSVSDIYLTVNDPRGRYVKTITVYFSPRQVSDIATLKSEEYGDKWQRCATLSLPRGASRASTTLAQPIVAANLKIEFTEFYERPGGSKASDGSMLVHCPRCTRVVTNAHGVCGNCGEVAFQCRKCRHINYDKLDAFLCVECGYCASGSFSFELTSGVASNAIAITNDKDHDRAAKMLGATISIQNELKNALREKISTIDVKKKSGSKKDDFESVFNPPMQRAFLDLPPIHDTGKEPKSNLDRVDKPGSVVKFAARPSSGSHSGSRSSNIAVDRTRSLLRLARQIRSESGLSSERRRSSDVIIRHLGRGLAIDHMEDEHDLIGLLESGGGNGLDSIAASPRRRGESSSSADPRRNQIEEVGGASAVSSQQQKKKEGGKEALEECQRLHILIREAERESFELSRRLDAWRRLDCGNLTTTNTTSSGSALSTTSVQFTPSHCSTCAVTVAHHLLALWLRLFTSHPSEIDIDSEFLCTLLEDVPGATSTSSTSTNSKSSLSDFKRIAVCEIAIKSKRGSTLVLSELQKRLQATNDFGCAEILGKIMMEVGGDSSNNFSMSEEYTNLATTILESAGRRNQTY